MTTTVLRQTLASLRVDGTMLHVSWADEHTSTFPSIWLLHACTCEECGSTETAVRHVKLTDQPRRPEIIGAAVEHNVLVIDWGAGHKSSFDANWLRGHCLSDHARAHREHSPAVWGVEKVNDLPYMDYDKVASDEDSHLAFLETLRDDGFVILQQVPAERERTEEVASLVGKLRMTNYGIYELEAKPNPEIAGDTAVALEPHTDEPYRIDPPGITFFHVLAQSEEGGDSTLVDGFYLAKVLQETDPGAFETLCSVPARFHRSLQEGRAFEMQAPIICTNDQGTVVGFRLLDRGMAPVDAPVEKVEAFYDSLSVLLDLSYGGCGRVTVKLAAGELLVFNNQRILHGRTSFNPATSHRHVRSCQVDLDEFHSRLRVAYKSRGAEEAWMALGTGTVP